MHQVNRDVRMAAKQAGIHLWRLGDRLGYSDANFSRLLRKELPEGVKARVFQIIEELSKEFMGEVG